ncbi:hypothetical protein TWF481_006103 [Arthrobotrys musiformis]|uniref:Clr5 domain-containing protein n=1 Tax=Arthrobotrys musiformis TaxID=47236 RepID=A0AAV9WGA8_9PEZI
MASRARRDGGVPEATPRRLYSPKEWEEKRPIIAKLKDEGKEQEQILKELEKQFPDFRPTLPMLKKRMREWKITSYHKEPDIAEAVRITADRERLNKKTVFTIGDKKVTQEEIQRYLRRKGIRNPRAWASTVIKQPASVIQIHTPAPSRPSSPSPGSSSSSGRSESSDDIEEIDRSSEISTDAVERRMFQEACDVFVSTASREHISQVVRGPHESQMLELAIWNTDYYCDMLFVLEDLNPGLADLTSDALNDFTNGMWKGWDYLFDDNLIAFTYFQEGFASLDRLVHSHNRRFLPELLEMLLNLRLEPRVDVLQILLQRLATLYKDSDPMLYDVFLSLLSLDNWNRLEVVERLMNKVLERFNRKLGPEDPETKSIQKALTRSVFRKLPVSKAITELQTRVEDENELTQELLYKKCNVCIELALCYRSRGDIAQVEGWILQAMLLSQQLESTFHQADISVRCHRVMSYVERNKGNWQAAYGHWQDAVVESSLGLGSTDSLTVLVESELRDFVKRAQMNGIVLVDEVPVRFEDNLDDFHNPDTVFETVSEPLGYFFPDIATPTAFC